MLPVLIVLVLVVGGLVLIMLAVVVTGIRRETRTVELGSQAPSLISAIARRLTGVHVRRPDTEPADSQPDPYRAGHGVEGQ